MSKKQESIWTKDITPHVVNFLTMDITPDFSSEFWTKDITGHVIGTLAVFGLVVSALVATAGVAAVGVNVEVALAQQGVAAQTATVLLAEDNQNVQRVPGMMPAAVLASTTRPMASSTPLFCPKISRSIGRGRSEATTAGDVGQLQQFIANHFGLNKDDVVTGFFGSTTQVFLEKFQEEQGITPAPFAGPLTRAAIARLGNPSSHDPATTRGDINREGGRVGSTTGSTTVDNEHRGRPVLPPAPAVAPVPPAQPVSYADNASNTANVLEAVNEIGDGYGRLLTATLNLMGL